MKEERDAMVISLSLFIYVIAVVLAIRKRGNWYRNILVLQGLFSAVLIGLFLLGQHTDMVLLVAAFGVLSFSFVGFIPRVRTLIGF